MMSHLSRRGVFLCLMSWAFVIFVAGCTSEEDKDAVITPPVTPQTSEAETPDTPPPPAETQKEPEPEKPALPVKPPETEPEAEEADALSESAPPKEPEEPVPPAEPAAEKDAVATAGSGPPAEFTLVSSLWETHTKSAPVFTHEKHSTVHKIACNQCHHIYESGGDAHEYVSGENMWQEGMPVDKCSKFHDDPTIKNVKKLPPAAQKKNLKLAFHNNCRGCHKGLKKENPETKAPVSCKQCHPPK